MSGFCDMIFIHHSLFFVQHKEEKHVGGFLHYVKRLSLIRHVTIRYSTMFFGLEKNHFLCASVCGCPVTKIYYCFLPQGLWLFVV